MSRAEDRRAEMFEREIARELETVFGEEFVAPRARCTDGSRPGPGVSAPDMWIECQRERHADPLGVLYDAEEESKGSGLWPVAICKVPGNPATVHMFLADFAKILAEWWSARLRRGGACVRSDPRREPEESSAIGGAS